MKIAIVSSFVPFINGGLRNIVDWLAAQLQEAGHQAEVIYLPFLDIPMELFSQSLAYRFMRLDTADRVICFRPPAFYINHPCKVVWFIHHIRVFYDLWNVYPPLPPGAKADSVRSTLHRVDKEMLEESHRLFTNSRIVSDRLRNYNELDSEVLYPPILNPERFRHESYGDEIVCVCRMEDHKRQHLLVSAMAHTKSAVRLRLVGRSGSPVYFQHLQQLVNELGLRERVSLEDRWISEEEKSDILANALATAYIPLDEDSYGYPTLEGSHARKPFITTTDSGGVLELAEQGLNSFISEPDPKALAEAMDALYRDKDRTARMGRHAQERIDALHIKWDHVLARLLS